MASASPQTAGVLSSWKEIASHLGKGVRTVQRWERELGLPVHRPVAKQRGIVLAFPEELHQWVEAHTNGGAAASQSSKGNGEPHKGHDRPHNGNGHGTRHHITSTDAFARHIFHLCEVSQHLQSRLAVTIEETRRIREKAKRTRAA